jgi:hypothetical protein
MMYTYLSGATCDAHDRISRAWATLYERGVTFVNTMEELALVRVNNVYKLHPRYVVLHKAEDS